MTCSFCSFVFEDSGARLQCQGCALAAGCRSVRCPRCAYEMPEDLRLLGWLQRWRDRVRARRNASATAAAGDRAAATPLARLRPGESGVIVDLRGAEGDVQKCLALGILPGARVTLRKRSPSFIFEIGFSRFAVDDGIANAVHVQ